MRILAIDPGLDGALAIFDTDGHRAEIIDIPTVKVMRGKGEKREIAQYALAHIVRESHAEAAYIELVGPMPKQGISSTFQFGRGVGTLEGVLAGLDIPVSYVRPTYWRKYNDVRKGKDASRGRAEQKCPALAPMLIRAKDHNRADAILIGIYALHRYFEVIW